MKLIKTIHPEKDVDATLQADLDQQVLLNDDVREQNQKVYDDQMKECKKIQKELLSEDLEDAMKEADAIVKDAQQEADQIIAAAQDEEAAKELSLKEESKNNLLTSTLKALLQDEWEAVEGYQNAITAIKANELAPQEVIFQLDDIISEEYIHIGQLQKMMEMNIAGAEDIDKGEAEAEPQPEEIPGEEFIDEPVPEEEPIAIEEPVVDDGFDEDPNEGLEMIEALADKKIGEE